MSRRALSVTGERGASAVEYALLVTLVAAVVLGGIVAVGAAVPGLFEISF